MSNLDNSIKELMVQMKEVSVSDLSTDEKASKMKELSNDFNKKVSTQYEKTKKAS